MLKSKASNSEVKDRYNEGNNEVKTFMVQERLKYCSGMNSLKRSMLHPANPEADAFSSNPIYFASFKGVTIK